MRTGFIFLFLLILSVVSGSFIKTVNNIEDFKENNPGVTLIEMDFEDQEQFVISRSYSLGVRQTGDSVVANGSNKRKWSIPQNVTTTLSYPSSGGNGAFLTYILINCEQSSNLGRAYVTSGGVGQHFIQIIVEAQVTNYFNYAAFFYGIK
ncbi:CLUMA_CG009137, isoform A [Clunio marinus]|uniref:CLUMA_CG009137, isoform A n=1 Tax=Clunio marinus TaxID=568069 RepID=A0A1J1I5S6_9DIPT|nr:CLUMA_CG009137, isoform A [Clunio marinus]